MTDKERERDRLDMKSGAKDPITAPSPQEVRAHPTEGEKLQWGRDAKRADLDHEMAKKKLASDPDPTAKQ